MLIKWLASGLLEQAKYDVSLEHFDMSKSNEVKLMDLKKIKKESCI